MRPSLKISLLFVAIWFTGKMIFFYGQIFQEANEVKFLVMWNILCLLLGMTIGTLIEKRKQIKEEGSALQDIKNGMASGMLYSVLVAVLMYFYYGKIDTGYNAQQVAVAKQRVEYMLNSPKEMKKLRKTNPELSTMSLDEIRDKAVANQTAMYSAGSVTTISLLGMMMLSTLNAIILTVIFRRVLSRIQK